MEFSVANLTFFTHSIELGETIHKFSSHSFNLAIFNMDSINIANFVQPLFMNDPM